MFLRVLLTFWYIVSPRGGRDFVPPS
ncbi:hypothetical protein LINPERPRIM_LOCUS16841 [Linum perenne]